MMQSAIEQPIRWMMSICLAPVLCFGVSGLAAPDGTEPLDYALLKHTVSIDQLRAGAHSAKGTNSYTFAVTLVGLLNAAEERNLDFEKRKKVVVDLGTFGDTSIVSLAGWKPDAKVKDFKVLTIDGQAIRELVAQTMTEFKAPESEVLVQVDISMIIKKKKWLLLKADEAVAKVSYAPIPATKFESALRTNQDLLIADEQGTFVKLAVRYEKPTVAEVKPDPKASKPEAKNASPVDKKP